MNYVLDLLTFLKCELHCYNTDQNMHTRFARKTHKKQKQTIKNAN